MWTIDKIKSIRTFTIFWTLQICWLWKMKIKTFKHWNCSTFFLIFGFYPTLCGSFCWYICYNGWERCIGCCRFCWLGCDEPNWYLTCIRYWWCYRCFFTTFIIVIVGIISAWHLVDLTTKSIKWRKVKMSIKLFY